MSKRQEDAYNALKRLGFGKKLPKNITKGKAIGLMQDEQFKATNGRYGKPRNKPKTFKTLDEKLNAVTKKWKKSKWEHPEVTQARKNWELHEGKGDENSWEAECVRTLHKHKYK